MLKAMVRLGGINIFSVRLALPSFLVFVRGFHLPQWRADIFLYITDFGLVNMYFSSLPYN